MTVTLGSELREAPEGLGGAGMIRTEGCGSEDMEREGTWVLVTDGADGDVGDGDLVRLRWSPRSFECRAPDCGLTNFEKKPGAIYHFATGIRAMSMSVKLSGMSDLDDPHPSSKNFIVT